MTCITLLTDFGTADEYVAVMKGVILAVAPGIPVIDITHHIPPQDVPAAADMIVAAFHWFPVGTVHVVVVDPGVGSSRAVVAAEGGGHFFIVPDNGIPAVLNDACPLDRIRRVEAERFFRHPVSATFHGRDIFAPVAARVAAGLDIAELGRPVRSEALARLPVVPPRKSADGTLTGRVVGVDRFGNLLTDISEQLLQDCFAAFYPDRLRIEVGTHGVCALYATYSDSPSGRLMGLIGSRGHLEIAVNCGSAKDHCGAERNTLVRVRSVPKMY